MSFDKTQNYADPVLPPMLVSPRFNQQESLVQKAHVCARLSTESLLDFILFF